MSRRIEAKASLTLSAEETSLRDTGAGKLLFTFYRERLCAALIRDTKLTMLHFPENSQVGAIFLARVKDVVPNISACFVEISPGELCFLPLKDAKELLLLNRKPDGRILAGDEFPVQIVRDAQKTKQASVTAHISFSNEYFAVSFGSPKIGISSKLDSAQKEALDRLLTETGIQKDKKFVQSLVADDFTEAPSLPQLGLIVRTGAACFCEETDVSAKEAAFSDAFEAFLKELKAFLKSCMHRTALSCIKEADGVVEKLLNQMIFPEEFSEIITDVPEIYTETEAYLSKHSLPVTLRLYQDTMLSLSKLYSLEQKITEALSERVWLKSGGYLVIQPTEALTVIDVNSGKYEKKKTTAGEAALLVNLEAAKEVARQLRLRNLSGIILVDFINMKAEEERDEVMRSLRKFTRADRIQTTVVDMTPLGLVEITRKKIAKPLYEQYREHF